MTHEKNMIDYLDWIKGVFLDKQTTLDKIYEKRDFNKSQPKLGDFVPTNKKGEVMEKPKYFTDKWVRGEDVSKESKEWQAYSEALDRVIWKGWKVEELVGYYVLVDKSRTEIAECYTDEKKWNWYDKNIYEKLINSGVKLERIQRK